MMAMKSFLTLATVALVTAESSVVSLFLPNVEGTALVASVVAQSAGTTTYSINCPPGTDSSDCGVSPGLILTSGSKKVEYSISEPGEFYGRMICSMGGTTTAVCTEIDSGSAANFPGTHTTTLDSTDISSLPVTITAGATTGTASNTSPTATGSSESATESTGSSAVEKSSDTTASQTSTPGTMTSSTSTGGMSQITGAPVLALGAAVALVAGAM